MAGGWPLPDGLTAGQVCGISGSQNAVGACGSEPTTTGSGSLNPGAWLQLISSTTRDTNWMLITADANCCNGPMGVYDIGVGASGSEVALVSHIVSNAYRGSIPHIVLPLAIRGGSRVSARMASTWVNPDQGDIGVTVFDSDFGDQAYGSAVDTIGFNPATLYGAAIDPGASANTKGAWTVLTSNTTADYIGFWMAFDFLGGAPVGSTPLSYGVRLDLGIGPSGGPYTVVLPDYPLVQNLYPDAAMWPQHAPYLAMPIPSGVALVARAQSANTTSATRSFGLTFYGVR